MCCTHRDACCLVAGMPPPTPTLVGYILTPLCILIAGGMSSKSSSGMNTETFAEHFGSMAGSVLPLPVGVENATPVSGTALPLLITPGEYDHRKPPTPNLVRVPVQMKGRRNTVLRSVDSRKKRTRPSQPSVPTSHGTPRSGAF